MDDFEYQAELMLMHRQNTSNDILDVQLKIINLQHKIEKLHRDIVERLDALFEERTTKHI